ncbi:stealth conserved region 3 domain-containing protein [Nocardioides sp.]|uniref:stealth conserved region 3 domain-containing protein n=1 Tax=Nocardioides sp. TaxID=35761 RepID=UPI002CB2CA22|nr:stealth conserved region 3 domain-containing protein [Nocardioides sp.]HSX66360.1 stealth conserved region 3 domain-containing protein [Nocardioides sp.]
MKLIVIADQARHARGGWQAAVRLGAAWRAAGHKAEIWVLEGEKYGHGAVPVRLFDRDRMAHEIARSRADALVSTSVDTLVLTVTNARSAARLVHWERYGNSTREQVGHALGLLGAHLDLVVTPDEVTRGAVAGLLPGACAPVVAIPDPVAAGVLPQTSGTERLIVAAGSFAAESGLGHLVTAFGVAADDLPGWRLRLLGRGPSRAGLAATVRAEGLCDRVELPGLSREMPLDWARAGIAVVAPFHGLSLTVTEAMAAGLPVIARDTADGARQRIVHDRTGVLVAQRSVPELAAALVDLATDPARRARLGAAAREAAAPFAPELVARTWIETLTGRPGHGAGEPGSPTASATATPAAPVVAPATALRDLVGGLLGLAHEASPEAFVLRPVGERRTVVVVPAAHRRPFLESLRSVTGLLVSEAPSTGDLARRPVELAVPAALDAIAPVLTVSSPDGAAEVDVEFWREAAGALRPPRDNEWVDHVALGSPRAEVDVAGLTVPTLPLAVGPTIFDRPFPIDVVYTWVDGSDPAWQERRDVALAQRTGISLDRASSGKARYTSRDELRYSMRSLHMFAPWVRRIFLVTDDQVPAWLATDFPQVTVVSHRDILAAEHLPVFNSHAIETGLHRIEGLSEHFIYFNDDVLLGRAVRPGQFFTAAGQFHAFVGAQSIGVEEQNALPYQRAGLNNRRLLRERFGVTTTRVMRHTPHPMRVSVLQALEKEWPEELRRTAASPFRSETDLSVASSLAQYYGLVTGTAVASELDATFVSLTQPNVTMVLRALLARRDRDSICLADHHVWAWPENVVTRQLHDFLEEYYPVRPPWEKPGA